MERLRDAFVVGALMGASPAFADDLPKPKFEDLQHTNISAVPPEHFVKYPAYVTFLKGETVATEFLNNPNFEIVFEDGIYYVLAKVTIVEATPLEVKFIYPPELGIEPGLCATADKLTYYSVRSNPTILLRSYGGAVPCDPLKNVEGLQEVAELPGAKKPDVAPAVEVPKTEGPMPIRKANLARLQGVLNGGAEDSSEYSLGATLGITARAEIQPISTVPVTLEASTNLQWIPNQAWLGVDRVNAGLGFHFMPPDSDTDLALHLFGGQSFGYTDVLDVPTVGLGVSGGQRIGKSNARLVASTNVHNDMYGNAIGVVPPSVQLDVGLGLQFDFEREIKSRVSKVMEKVEPQKLEVAIMALAKTEAVYWEKGANVEDVDKSEGIRLSEEMVKFAARNAWLGVEQDFRRLEKLQEKKHVGLSIKDLKNGADSGRAVGDIKESYKRISAVLEIEPGNKEATDWIEVDVKINYGDVSIEIAKKSDRTTFEPVNPPFAPDQRQAIVFAKMKLQTTGKFDGFLPAGKYVIAGKEFEVLNLESGKMTEVKVK